MQPIDMNPSPPPFQQFQRQLLASLRDSRGGLIPCGVPVRRLRLYRELLYNKIEASLLACFPITRALLGQRRWIRLVKAFIAEHRCLRPCYRQIPDEFVSYLEMRGLGQEDPPCLVELAHYEWMELVLMIAEGEPPTDIDPAGNLLAHVPVLVPVLNLLCYRHPVHRIRPDLPGWSDWKQGTFEEGAQPTFVLGFRAPDDDVRFNEISATTARLIERLLTADRSGREVLGLLAAELAHPDPEQFVSYGAAMLRDLKQHGAILGACSPRVPSNEREYEI